MLVRSTLSVTFFKQQSANFHINRHGNRAIATYDLVGLGYTGACDRYDKLIKIKATSCRVWATQLH